MSDITVGNVSFIGPFQEQWKVSLGGYRLPMVSAIPQEDGNICLSLDERYLIEGTPEECAKWLWFVANAMAIGAGYSCFGENSSKDPNPFKVQMARIALPPKLDLVKDEEPKP
jgi:hypothetical protein